ncbi:MAG: HIRAN domain-containing protein [Mycoplasma sp.]|nr:HIRAN domain-containing protein [Mycoplasma sp.]MDY4544188.1 HIRAN domain-containing protein [Bacilli bacterium]MDY4618906.1 HIRAN domain-containing protein [Bacilli bacterium]
MNNELWLIWKEPLSHKRFKIGILIKLNDGYEFSYVDPELGEARKVGFNFFPGFNDLSKTYKNNELFINIASRLPNKGRIDYLEILNSYNLDKESSDFDILKATRGRTLTDNYEFVPAFDLNKIEFDVAGTRHCKDINKCKDFLKINRVLYLEPEPNNKNDENAVKVVLKENGKLYHLGYVPRYYSKELLNELNKGAKYSAMIQNLKFNSPFSDENIVANVKLIFDV